MLLCYSKRGRREGGKEGGRKSFRKAQPVNSRSSRVYSNKEPKRKKAQRRDGRKKHAKKTPNRI